MSYRLQNLLVILVSLFIIGTVSLPAQNLIIEKGTIIHNGEPRACIQIMMDPLPKEVKKAWHDYLDDNFDINLRGIGFLTNKDMLKREAVSFPEISSQEISIYTRVIEQGNLTEMSVFAAITPDTYLNEKDYPIEFNRLQNVVEAFIGSYLPDHYQTLVQETEEKLKDLIDERDDLTDDISDNRDKIVELEKENLEKERELTKVEDQIQRIQNILDARREKQQQIDRQLVNQRLK